MRQQDNTRSPETESRESRPSRLTIPSTMRSRYKNSDCARDLHICLLKISIITITVPSITGSCNPGRDRTHAACTLQADTSTEPSNGNAQWPGNEVGARAASASDTRDRSRQLRGRTRTRARSAEGTEPALTVRRLGTTPETKPSHHAHVSRTRGTRSSSQTPKTPRLWTAA